jgi:flavodoxin
MTSVLTVVVACHSGYGHTQKVADAVAQGGQKRVVQVPERKASLMPVCKRSRLMCQRSMTRAGSN